MLSARRFAQMMELTRAATSRSRDTTGVKLRPIHPVDYDSDKSQPVSTHQSLRKATPVPACLSSHDCECRVFVFCSGRDRPKVVGTRSSVSYPLVGGLHVCADGV